MLKVVFDTNVIVSAALYEESLPALLLSLGLEDKVRFFVSPALLNEYKGRSYGRGTFVQKLQNGLRQGEICENIKARSA